MSLAILGIGTAQPAHRITQEDACTLAQRLSGARDGLADRLRTLYRRSAVSERASVVLQPHGTGSAFPAFFQPAEDERDMGPTTGERLEQYRVAAAPLAHAAATAALDRAGVPARHITHLITVSCTGFAAPGVDAALVESLGLAADVARTSIGFMGCHGAINALRVASAFGAQDPHARVLICAVELCSLHYHYGQRPDRVIANALFADGAAAMVAASSPAKGAWRVVATGSRLFPDSHAAMSWRIGDHGFEMGLAPEVPAILERHVRPWITDWLAGVRVHGPTLRPEDVASWAIHPGGPRVLAAVGTALGLDDSRLRASREVLSRHGNMSSPTVLFILDALMRNGSPRPCALLAFGPGVVAESALVE